MKISVEFLGDETKIILRGDLDAEKHILGLIYSQKQLVEIRQDYAQEGFTRPYDASPNKLTLVLKVPPLEPALPEGNPIP